MATRLWVLASALAAVHAASPRRRRAALALAATPRGGADDRDALIGAAFAAGADAAEKATAAAAKALEELKPVDGLGEVLGAAYDKALGAYDAAAPADCADERARLESAVDASLELLFVKQLALVRAKVLAGDADASAVEKAVAAAADAAKRPGAAWDASAEATSAAAVARELEARSKRAADVASKARAQQQQYLQVFQLYQAQIAQLKQAVGQQPAKLVASYRVPDADVALSVTRGDDRTTLSLGCVPDDSAPLLGPQGFVCGLTPLNLGLTLNLHV